MRSLATLVPVVLAVLSVAAAGCGGGGGGGGGGAPPPGVLANTLSVGSPSGTPGSAVEVPFTLTPAPGQAPAALTFDLLFSEADLEFQGVTTGPAATGAGKSASANLSRPGNVRVVVAALNNAPVGSGLLCAVSFRIRPGRPPGFSPVSVRNLVGADGSAAAVPTIAGDGQVTIQ